MTVKPVVEENEPRDELLQYNTSYKWGNKLFLFIPAPSIIPTMSNDDGLAPGPSTEGMYNFASWSDSVPKSSVDISWTNESDR